MKPQSSFLVVALLLPLFGVGSWPAGSAWAQSGTCTGDCNSDGTVTVDELIMGVNITLGSLSLDQCPQFDPGGTGAVSIDALILGVNNGLAGCSSPTNRAPLASDVSLSADSATAYVEKQLIGSDPDNDTITYELIADDTGTGYDFAFVNPESGVLYAVLAADFQGTIVLPYHVTDGKLFSNTANVTIEVQANIPSNTTGRNVVDPRDYAGYPRGFYDGARLGAPGADPMLPSAVDLSKDFPRPGDQGNQSSCVAWSTGYAVKSYQERIEIGWSLEPMEHRFSPAYIYNQINHGRDIGSWFADALNLVVDQGIATLDLAPYNDRDFLTQPSAAAVQEASQFKALSWRTANGTLEIKDALANHLPVIVGIEVFGDLTHLRGTDSVYNTLGGGYEGSHAVTVVGYDDQRYGGAFKIINSWGQTYGDGGYFWLPYAMATQVVAVPWGRTSILDEAYVLEDKRDTTNPPPDPVDPPPLGQLPDLQVIDWHANFDGRPGGSGSLQYTVTNTGVATAPAGAYVGLIVSRDPTFTSTNSLVVYERIPFDMPPGTTAFRDQNNSIAFNFPSDLEPGQYYMSFKVDMFNDVAESNEGDNLSPAAAPIAIVNTLPDMQVGTWYAHWSDQGLGGLTYELTNQGASVAPAGWLITLALSPNDIFGDGDEIFLFSEPANFDVDPGGTLYRNDSSSAGFLLYFDYQGHRVPDGVYYMALWLDPNGSLAESNEFNNASLSWGTIGISRAAGFGAGAGDTGGKPSSALGAIVPGDAYNGKTLPAPAVRKVRLSTTPQGRQTEFLGAGDGADSGPRVKAVESHQWSKTARARQQVIFPVTEMKPMPGGD